MILTLLLMNWACLTYGEPCPEGPVVHDYDGPGVLDFILELTGEDRSWARPIETADMELIEELEDSGWLTFHSARWWVRSGNER